MGRGGGGCCERIDDPFFSFFPDDWDFADFAEPPRRDLRIEGIVGGGGGYAHSEKGQRKGSRVMER
jgi:hypothetical protein